MDRRAPTRAVALLAAAVTVLTLAAGGPPAGAAVPSHPGSAPAERSQAAPALAGAAGVVPRAGDLGPVHRDPVPDGGSLREPTDTRSLLERAGVQQARLADAGRPLTSGSSAPVGTPSVRSLSRHVAPSCSGSGSDGNRVQVLYAHEARTRSRFGQVLPILRDQVAGVDDVFAVSARQTGGDRRVRWVHDGGCLPVIRDVTLPDGSLGSSFVATIRALRALGYTDPHRKYLTFADANRLCGIGTVYDDPRPTGNENDGLEPSYARVDANCWATMESVPAHELTHNLGGVLGTAPHATRYGHCYDDADLMCYDDGSGIAMRTVCPSAQEQLLDCRHDDYFNTDPAPGSFLARSWNTASSSFLDRVVAAAVTVRSSARSARTGDPVTFTAAAGRPVTWTWRSSAPGCTLSPGRPGRAALVCPASVTGPVTVTATATGTTDDDRSVSTGHATVTLRRAAAPTATLIAPPSVQAGEAFPVTVRAGGRAPLRFAWRAGGCSVDPRAGSSGQVRCASSVPSQDLPVSVLVTQADGQSVRTTAWTTVTGPVPGVVTGTAWSVPAVETGRWGAVLTSGGAALPGRPVRVEVRWSGTGAWTTLRTVTSDAAGSVSIVAVPARAGSFRFVSAGSVSFGRSVSAATYLRAGTRLVLTRPRPGMVAGRLRTLDGRPVPAVGLRWQRRWPGTARWATVAVVRTDAAGRAVRRVRPARVASYRWQSRTDARHLGAVSGPVTIR